MPQLKPEQIKCEYGELVGDDGCHCKIEDNVLRGQLDAMSMGTFCMGQPTLCPTLRKEKEGISLAALQKDAAAIRSDRRDKREAREERVAAMQELLTSNSKEGEAMRLRVRRILARSENQERLRRAGARESVSGLVLPPGVR